MALHDVRAELQWPGTSHGHAACDLAIIREWPFGTTHALSFGVNSPLENMTMSVDLFETNAGGLILAIRALHKGWSGFERGQNLPQMLPASRTQFTFATDALNFDDLGEGSLYDALEPDAVDALYTEQGSANAAKLIASFLDGDIEIHFVSMGAAASWYIAGAWWERGYALAKETGLTYAERLELSDRIDYIFGEELDAAMLDDDARKKALAQLRTGYLAYDRPSYGGPDHPSFRP